MMISQEMNAAVNQQIGREFGASLQYVAIAAHFASEGLAVLAEKFFQQAEEEREHAMKFLKFIVEAGGRVELPAIAAPQNSFSGAEEAVRLSLEWEQTVTQQINQLMKLAVSESDYLSQNFLGWFVTEQMEEVSSMENLLRLVQRAGEKNLMYVEGYLARQGGK